MKPSGNSGGNNVVRPDFSKELVNQPSGAFSKNSVVASPYGGGSGSGGGMEARIAKLESDVTHLQRDVGELRDDVKNIRERLPTLEEKIEHLPTKGFIITVTLAALALATAAIGYQERLQSVLPGASHQEPR